MDQRTDVKSRWREQHHSSSKAAWLQSRWQEVSERERRAQLHNRKLLQDFQRAQDTLTDLVARTEAMNTIRVEYERYLEQNFPRWQQKLKDKRLTEQRKRIEEHLKAFMQQVEEDQRITGGKTSSITTSSSSSISPDVQKPRSTPSKQDDKQNLQGIVPNDSQPFYVPFTRSSETEPKHRPQYNISKQTKTFQNIHQALNSPQPLPADQQYGPYPVIQHGQPSSGHLKPWCALQSAGAPWSGVPVNPLVWKMLRMSEAERVRYSEEELEETWRKDSNSEPENHQTKRRRRKKLKGSEGSSESAHLSDSHGDSSVSGALSSRAVKVLPSSGTKRTRMRNRMRKETETHRSSSSGEKDSVHQGSSSMSDCPSDTNKVKDKIIQSSPATRTTIKTGSKASKTQTKNIPGLGSCKHLDEEREQEGNGTEDKLTDSSTALEKKKKNEKKIKKRMKKNEEESVEEKHLTDREEQVSNDREERKVEVEEESDDVGDEDEEQDEDVRSEGLCRKRKNGGRGSECGSFSEKEAEKKEERDGGGEEEEEDEEEDGEIEGKEGGEDKEDDDDGGDVEVEEEDDGGDVDEEEKDDGGDVDEEEDDGGDVDEEEDDGGDVDEEEDDGGDVDEEEDDGGDVNEEEEDGGEEEKQKDGDYQEDEDDDGGEEDGAEEMRQIKGSDDESDDEGHDGEAASSNSRRNAHNSLKDLYKDEDTEDEELCDQEIEDDIEEDEDDDDDDDVVVEKAYPWTRGPAYNHTKYQDSDDDDDVEGLLAPQMNTQQHQSDKSKETIKSKDSQRDSEEDGSHRKPVADPVMKDKRKDESAGSDDEFDHFYD